MMTENDLTQEAPDGDAGQPVPAADEPAPVAAAPAGEAPADGEQPSGLKMSWYVLHTYSGYEKKVREQLRERLKQHGMAGHVGQILIPEEKVVEIKSGKKRESMRMFFPGYVLIEMAMDEKVWYVVKETPRITGFLGDANLPTPLRPDEVARLRGQIEGGAERPRPKHTFNVGEAVRVTDGPFANFSGELEEVNMERGKVKVMVTIFGRATPVELEFAQIEKV